MLLLADKPTGLSSFDVLRALKKVFPPKTSMGHAGTLDPLATGLMIIGTDKDTKQLHALTEHSKCYHATIDLSKRSDTWDSQYRDISTYHTDIIPDHTPTVSDIHDLCNSLAPSLVMQVPYFAAKKIDGKKLYEYARAGIYQEMKEDMVWHSVRVISYERPVLNLACHVGSGTYIRSLAYWVGVQLGCGGIITQLRRLSIDDYTVDMISGDTSAIRYTNTGNDDDVHIPYTILPSA